MDVAKRSVVASAGWSSAVSGASLPSAGSMLPSIPGPFHSVGAGFLSARHSAGFAGRQLRGAAADSADLGRGPRRAQGSLYPALNRLEHQGLIESEWGESENRRRAKYYRLTRSGRRRFQEDAAGWERLAAAMQAPSARRRTRSDVFSRLLSLLTAWIRRERFEDGLDDEVRFHLDAHAEDLVRSGVPRLEGIRTARPRAAGSGGAGPAGRVRQARESAARQSAGARGGNSGCAFPSGPRGPDSCGNSW